VHGGRPATAKPPATEPEESRRWKVSAVIDVPADRDATVVAEQLATGLADFTSRPEGRRLWLAFTLADRNDIAWFLPSGFGALQFIIRRAN